MACEICKKKEVSVEGKCRSCFVKYLEAKARKNIHISRNDRVMLMEGQNAGAKVLGFILDAILAERNLTVERSDVPKEGFLIFSLENLDDRNAKFLGEVFRNISAKTGDKFIFPLADITQAECEAYCRIKNIEFEKNINSVEDEFIKKIEKEHIHTRHALGKSQETFDEKN